MKQRAKVLIEFSEDTNVAWLKKQLKKLGCKVEAYAVFLPLENIELPKNFKFEDEKTK